MELSPRVCQRRKENKLLKEYNFEIHACLILKLCGHFFFFSVHILPDIFIYIIYG